MSASIKSLFVEDFQSHSKSKVELAPPGGLTVIVGPTDSGKTALVRALRLLFYNVPQGTDYIRVGRNMATVAVELADGTKVARERSKSVNRYRVVRPGESPTVLEGFGNTVPLEIQEATGVRMVSVGDLELALNLSEQLDAPFLGQKTVSGPARAKILGKLAGTEEVDEAQRALGTDLFRAGQDEKRLLSEIEDLDAKIREYDYLPALAEKITALEVLLQIIREAQNRLASLEAVSQKLASIQTQRAQTLSILARWKNLREAEFCIVTAEGDAIRLNAVVSHKTAFMRITADRETWARLLARWVNLPVAETSIKEADSAQSRLQALQSASETLAATQTGKEKVATTLQRWANLPKSAEFIAQITDAANRLQVLTSLQSRHTALSTQARTAMQVCTNWAGLDDTQNVISAVNADAQRLAALMNLSASLTKLREARIAAENDLDRRSKALADARRQYADTLLTIGKCPVCGSQVDPSLIKEVA
ncbi:MAG TPA: AAA family ATPase [Firmicutes bacterium]|nr:AAA family ATPase [Candidatus Fermentithermobacillaceae bacterium]